ncbi:PepSY domain-containing protein [Streptomyces coelicolor]|nr:MULTISPECIES: PepSY domain-containing protein [Streptomyces]MDX2923342.1 PepSY domain-containing protein [Streptomyces sp. NRRL_B-16638]MDX3408789.1 PepSY domain-containing protein [Streptomyces sp. ME02-6977A]NSL80043.1 PepSY domain-containing protein [Streptomyces coelicolor]QKN71061.1 PepSY domain-containing protein [Streptomyces coelicolor]WMT27076.1 PepSY domain-containing protein [Streptomyces coelicolor]
MAGGTTDRRTRSGWWPLLTRLHFYAGVLIAPFLLVAALTGLAYTAVPQLDQLVYSEQLRVEKVGDTAKPLTEQIAAARKAHPEGSIASVIPPEAPDHTTKVVLSVPELAEQDKQRTVYVDPYTGEVRGALTTWFGSTPLATWLDDLHRHLHLGETGRLYSELAASWLWVLVLGGLLLWFGRRRAYAGGSKRNTLLPERGARGVRRSRGLHAVTGVWISAGLLVLSATGLTWSAHAGERFTELRTSLSAYAPELDTSLSGGADGNAGHDHSGGHEAATSGGLPAGLTVDQVLEKARAAGLDGPVEISTPADDRSTWSVAQTDGLWPVRMDQAAVDPHTGEVTARVEWADHPVLAKLSTLGVRAHMGTLFGLANQIVLAVIALGLTTGIVLGYRMWWQRRPTRGDRRAPVGRAPARGTWRQLPWPALAVAAPLIIAVGWAFPLLGWSLLAFLVLDALLGLIHRRRADHAAVRA